MKYVRYTTDGRTYVIRLDAIVSMAYSQGVCPEGEQLSIKMLNGEMAWIEDDANRLYAHLSAMMEDVGMADVGGQGIRFTANLATD